MDEGRANSSTKLVFEKNMKICSQAYILSSKLGQGNFGQVFLGIRNCEVKSKNHKANKQIAIKIERDVAGKQPQLPNEAQIMRILNQDGHSVPGFPMIYDYGIQRGNYFIIMDLLGPNLMDLMKICGGSFSVQTTIILAIQMFQRIQFLHGKGFLCRDIKPQNFLMGCGLQSSVLYLIDFGLSRRYRDQQSGLHRPYKQDRSFHGTLRYASICSHLRIQQSRRDDLQSLCYVLIFFLKGELPWQHYRNESTVDSKQKWILEKKIKTLPSVLCEGLPMEIKNILQYCLDLEYYEDPDYNYIHTELNELYQQYIGQKQFMYDWAKQKEQIVSQKDQKVIKIYPYEGNGEQLMGSADQFIQESDEQLYSDDENEEINDINLN